MSSGGSGYEADQNVEPNVVPMIDVMLVLLIIMMIVTPILSAGFTATMPSSQNPLSRPEEEDEIVMGIDNQGKFYLQQLPIPDENLEEALTSLFAARTKDKILFLKADRETRFGRVQQVVEAARRSGVRLIGTVTERREDMFGDRKEN